MQEQKQQNGGQKIGIVGGGLMGHGIAYLFAAAGHNVGVFEPDAALRASLPQRLRAIADLLDDDPAFIGRIAAHDALAPALQDAAFVFEAAPEKLPLKQQIFAERPRNELHSLRQAIACKADRDRQTRQAEEIERTGIGNDLAEDL